MECLKALGLAPSDWQGVGPGVRTVMTQSLESFDAPARLPAFPKEINEI